MNVKVCDMCGSVIQKTYFQADVFAQVKILDNRIPADYDFCETCSRQVIDVINQLMRKTKSEVNNL